LPNIEKDERSFDRIDRITGIKRGDPIEAIPSLFPESAARFWEKALRFCNPVNPVNPVKKIRLLAFSMSARCLGPPSVTSVGKSESDALA
jgi:hypothetical protein